MVKTYDELTPTERNRLWATHYGKDIALREPDEEVEVPGGTHMVYHHADGTKTYLFQPAGQQDPKRAVLIGREDNAGEQEAE